MDPTSLAFQEDGEFTHTNIYGAYDPDGDDVRRLTFAEPMIAVDFFHSLEKEIVVELKTPDRYFIANDYLTTYVMEPDHGDGFYVSIDEFETFPGPSE